MAVSVVIWLLLSMSLALGVGFYLLAPFFESQGALAEGAGYSVDSISRLNDSKERALRELKDLELDFKMGKVSNEDYDRSQTELSLQVGKILEELKKYA
jgi:hypothetical protein